MQLDASFLDKLYKQYGYKEISKSDSVKLYLYEQGRYYGADIVPLNESMETEDECKKIKSEYGEGGYAVQIKKYSNNEKVHISLQTDPPISIETDPLISLQIDPLSLGLKKSGFHFKLTHLFSTI